MKLLAFVLCFCINSAHGADSCLNILVDKAYNPNFKADYFLFIPVESSKYKKARLMILKENFRKYMIAFDSSYAENDKLKNYLKELLTKKKTLFFHEIFYTKNFGSIEYKLLTEKNRIDINTSNTAEAFLKKYLLDFSSTRNYFNIDVSKSIKNFHFVYENLFKLNYLVAYGDGVIAVFKVNCK